MMQKLRSTYWCWYNRTQKQAWLYAFEENQQACGRGYYRIVWHALLVSLLGKMQMHADIWQCYFSMQLTEQNCLPSMLLPSVGDVLVSVSAWPGPSSTDSPVSPLVLKSGPRTIPCFWTKQIYYEIRMSTIHHTLMFLEHLVFIYGNFFIIFTNL